MRTGRPQAMTHGEMDLWVGLQMVRSDECPQCGSNAKLDMMTKAALDAHCPVCGADYRRITGMRGSKMSTGAKASK